MAEMDFGWDQVHVPLCERWENKVHCVSQALTETSVPTQRAWGEVFTIGSNQIVEVVA